MRGISFPVAQLIVIAIEQIIWSGVDNLTSTYLCTLG